jgi:hypothetical protein
MKKMILTALFALGISAASFANATEENVSTKVLTSFKTDFSEATQVGWVISSNYTKAVFMQNGVKMEAFYNNDSELIGYSEAIVTDMLPVKAQNSLANKYGDYVVKEQIRFTSDTESCYYISLENNQSKLILKVLSGGTIEVFKKTQK